MEGFETPVSSYVELEGLEVPDSESPVSAYVELEGLEVPDFESP